MSEVGTKKIRLPQGSVLERPLNQYPVTETSYAVEPCAAVNSVHLGHNPSLRQETTRDIWGHSLRLVYFSSAPVAVPTLPSCARFS
jgi:hypothetical protein